MEWGCPANNDPYILTNDWLAEHYFDGIRTGSPALYGRDDTFLHILCAGQPTISGISKLLHYYASLELEQTLEQEHQNECSNKEVENWSIVSHQNKNGATPLHVAVARSAHPFIIAYLLQFRKHCQKLLKHHKGLYHNFPNDEEKKDGKNIPLSSISMNGRSLPLHLVFLNKKITLPIQRNIAIETAILLLRDYPNALWSLNFNDETPLHIMWQNYFSHISSWLSLLSRQYRTFNDRNNFDAANLQAARAEVWDKIGCLLDKVLENGQRKIEIDPKDTSESLSSTSNMKSIAKQSSNSRDTSATTSQCEKLNTPCSVLDILISKIPRCPPVIVDAALSKIDNENHQDLLIYLHQFDINGKLILHCAAEIEHWKYGNHQCDENNAGPYCILKVSAARVTTTASNSETNSTQRSSGYDNDYENISVTRSSLSLLTSKDDERFY